MENKILTLQEKMVRIRARIPALVKQTYSEEVSYDFIKIDDIFRYLTPAMNEQGVNFDIISETATRKDERGNPMFVEYIPLYQMWIYEADLTFQWTNAGNPEDQLQVTVHAIGFHQMPEKAKGSGWTYCLKYYLLNKFCINQGGDDPDMRNVAPPSDESQGEPEEYLEGEWNYGEENGYPQGDGMEPAAYQETEYGFQEMQELAENGEGFGEEPEETEGAIDGLQAEADGFQSLGQGSGEMIQEMPEEPLPGEAEDYSVNPSPIGPGQGTMVHLPKSAGGTMELPETGSANGKANDKGGKHTNTQRGSRSIQRNGQNSQGTVREGMSGVEKTEAMRAGSAEIKKGTNVANLSNSPNPVQPSANLSENQGGMTVEEACNVLCNCGFYRGKTLGEIARSGPEGIQNLKWFVNSYRGRNEELRIGAKVLLEAAMAA
ncbi:hypothetical protein D3Z58_25140 [Clostridiaceae bacterium]|nr:hypothetical protein [Clostridiaceae bacterium]